MINYIKRKLKDKVTPRLYDHILSVAKISKYLARYYGYNQEAAEIAGLLHDYTKQELLDYSKIKPEDRSDYLEKNPSIWHGYSASYTAKEEFGINDKNILDAIKYHSTSKKGLNPIGKIVFIADSIAENRSFPQLEYLRLTEKNLEDHYKKVLFHKVNYLNQNGIEIGPNTKSAIEEEKNERATM